MQNLIQLLQIGTLSVTLLIAIGIRLGTSCNPSTTNSSKYEENDQIFALHPIGKITKKGNSTYIEIHEQYQEGLMGLDQFSEVTVIYWFDKNDTPEQRAILQVHPGGDKNNPMRGVFSTHAPVRPNLIAISRCKILQVKDNIIEIEKIDAFDGTPVLDLKN